MFLLVQLIFSYVLNSEGALELASAGIGVSIFNILSKIFNIPLLSIATSFVAEDISKNASKYTTSGNWVIRIFFLNFISHYSIFWQ